MMMKRIGIVGTAAAFIFLGIMGPAWAQEDHSKQDAGAKPAEQPKAEQPRAANPPEQAKAPAQHAQASAPKEQADRAAAPKAKPTEQAHAQPTQEAQRTAQSKASPAKAQQAKAQPKVQQARPAEVKSNNTPQRQVASGGRPQRTQQAVARQRSQPALRLSARTNTRIPDEQFRANFGAQHTFVISQPVIVGGYSRFQYGGFWFGFENPWPEGWYYTDNVYVDYVDGEYYLYNPYYPGVRVAIDVAM